MSFGAKKLRVQLPCGTDGSVIEDQAGHCRVFTCEPGTCEVFSCAFETGPLACQFPSAECHVGVSCYMLSCYMYTCPMGSCPMGSCHMGTCPNLSCGVPSCHFGTCAPASCRARTIAPTVECGAESVLEERAIIVDADQLPVLRARLEAQLEEIRKAEQAVEERRESDK
jgi:hypothetical protein